MHIFLTTKHRISSCKELDVDPVNIHKQTLSDLVHNRVSSIVDQVQVKQLRTSDPDHVELVSRIIITDLLGSTDHVDYDDEFWGFM